MDPTTWNAYQIVSNRARAICYATRQQQFRMKAEYTVNKLVHTTENQVHAMYEIKVKIVITAKSATFCGSLRWPAGVAWVYRYM